MEKPKSNLIIVIGLPITQATNKSTRQFRRYSLGLLRKYNLNISVGKDFFPISNSKQKNINFEFSTGNGRGKDVEYYSSFIFSIEVKLRNTIKTLVAGGRYNDLTSKNLGLKKIPAVGAAISIGN